MPCCRSYSMQVLLKCCKPIPVLFGEKLFAGRRHSRAKHVSVLLLVGGVAAVLLNQQNGKGGGEALFVWTFESCLGMSMVLAGLVCDGYYGPGQVGLREDEAKKGHSIAQFHNMFAMNFGMMILVAARVAYGGTAPSTLEFCARHPEVFSKIAMAVATQVSGNIVIYYMLTWYGSLTVTTVTTLRKLISILVDVFLNGYRLNAAQWAGVFVVVFSKELAKLVPQGKRKAA